MTIVSNRWPPMPLSRKATQSEAPGLADIPQALAGNSATLKGHIAGGAAVVDVGNPAPVNPSGDLGHDHSGGSYGRAQYKSIATISFDDSSFWNNSKWTSDADADRIGNAQYATGNDYIRPLRLEPESGQPGDTTYTTGKGEFQIWVPPCDLKRGAYLNCSFSVVFAYDPESFWTQGGGNFITAADEIFIYLRNLHPQAQSNDPNITGFRYAGQAGPVLQPHLPGFKFLESAGNMLLFPGQINPLSWRVKQVLDPGGGGPRACLVQPLHVEFGVYDVSSS